MHSNKWLAFQQVYNEIKELKGNVPEQYDKKLLVLINRFERIGSLKRNLDEEDYLLKKQYIKLAKEKALYSSKLNDITSIGNNLEWEERSKLLEKIRPIIEGTKKKLRADPKMMGNQSNVSNQN